MNYDPEDHLNLRLNFTELRNQKCRLLSFPKLKNKKEDYSDPLFTAFLKHAEVPVINLESSILHPCQSLADMITIKEHQKNQKCKIVLSWAPHPRALPQAVSNSFLEWINKTDNEVIVTHPPGYELDEQFTDGCTIEYNQDEALKDADFVYVKNWSSLSSYGTVINQDKRWMITEEKMKKTNNAYLMHCLPVRRNVVISDAALNSKNSLVIRQAGNRTHAAKAVLYQILKDNF